MKTVAIITAAGCGKRMGRPKQFIEIGGKPILERTLTIFNGTKVVDEMILVVNPEDVERSKKLKFSKLKKVIAGGKERQDSVFNGLKALPEDAEIVAIHDGARPFVSEQIIEKAISEAKDFGAVVVGVPVKDTIKKIRNPTSSRRASARGKFEIRNNGHIVIETLNRESLWAAQTPQVFKKEIIVRAYQGKHQVTDDAMLVEKLGVPIKMIMGSYQNIKITTAEDLKIARGFLEKGE